MKKIMIALCAAALASAAFAEEAAPEACGCRDGAECKCAPCECRKPECPKPPCASCGCQEGAECKCAPCECRKPECPKPPCAPCKCRKPGCDEKKFQRPPAIFLDAKTDPAAIEAFKKDVLARIDKAVADAADAAAPIRVMLIVNDRAPRRGPGRHGRQKAGRHDKPCKFGPPPACGEGAMPQPPPADMPPPPAEAPAPAPVADAPAPAAQ